MSSDRSSDDRPNSVESRRNGCGGEIEVGLFGFGAILLAVVDCSHRSYVYDRGPYEGLLVLVLVFLSFIPISRVYPEFSPRIGAISRITSCSFMNDATLGLHGVDRIAVVI